MGRKSCCSRSYSACSPCAPACGFPCAPFCGPCPPPFCGPCAPFCGPCLPPCGPIYCDPCCGNDCYDCYNSEFAAQSTVIQDISGSSTAPGTVVIFETETKDCANEYSANTFVPKCKGCFKFNVSIAVITNLDDQNPVTVYLNLTVNNQVKAQSNTTILANATGGPLSLNKSLHLCKGDIVNVTIYTSTDGEVELSGLRTFTGCKLSCKSSCC